MFKSSSGNSTPFLCPHSTALVRAAGLDHPSGSGCLTLRRLCQRTTCGKHNFPIPRLTRPAVRRNSRVLRHHFSVLRCNFPVVWHKFRILRFTTGGFPCPPGVGNHNLVEDVSKIETTQRR
jgi:hypothetical protein